MKYLSIVFLIFFILLSGLYAAPSSALTSSNDMGVYQIQDISRSKDIQFDNYTGKIKPAALSSSNYRTYEQVMVLKIILGVLFIQCGLICALIMAVRFKI